MNGLLRNWREAEWAVRAIYFVIAAEIVAAVILLAIAVH
jgi:hypothetical protein